MSNNIPSLLSIKKAAELYNIDLKWLQNYVFIGGEIAIEKKGRTRCVSMEALTAWNSQRMFSSVLLDKEDYLRCLDFALKSFYAYTENGSTSDFGTAQQRDAGKFVSNFVIGKLGEIAIQKFLKKNFDIDISLDFDLRDSVVGQDITEIRKPRGKGPRVYNPLKMRVGVKTSKMKNIWLIVPKKEVDDTFRVSDVYIFSRVNLYPDHFIRIMKGHKELERVNSIILDFEDINAEVCGFIYKDDLILNGSVTSLPEPKQTIQPSYIMASGSLKKTREEWEILISKL